MNDSPPAAIDTQILGWLMQETRPDDIDGPSVRARWLWELLDASETTIFLPSPALVEFLAPLAAPERKGAFTMIDELFEIAPLDTHAAYLASELVAQGGDDSSLVRIAIIVGAAKSANAVHFYSTDPAIRALAAQCGMEGMDLPSIPPNLWPSKPPTLIIPAP